MKVYPSFLSPFQDTKHILAHQCEKYNIEYFDTSNNRREVLENILNRIVKENG